MLIIYAHPNHDGHCGYILKQLTAELDSKKIVHQVIDLYQENYNPVLQPKEHYTSGNYAIAKETKKYQKLLEKERSFVIIYPTWWNGTPAILKGFFDRTLTNRFAFRYNKYGFPKGLLTGKVAVITTTGGPAIAEKLILGNRSLKVVVKETLRFCGFKAKGFMVDQAKKLTDKNKRKIEKIVSLATSYLTS
ncbi:NAD(P)H-dependent oxidoreductase [bacterium]|jgi:NAD(P)H dehydrogenase (quinone)|nr:NAD(P)H-dependent oxidoreductase [bacterium]MBT4250801.1 NAD(P)H-dependent oxidoreductase [bacterium]MBT4598197.1 NAD(P)H-dependent oxidoreductase [bacterium]MBT6753795.1 NAD(P)H-dependent oxidoreductase [bacterium]MBT7037492.1 NAD(P)H-dependent oxidoreductase [bacterium]